jgi:uncharacterized membrane protein YeaQ/YmgE (transglycosylase-associated protein family)
MAMLGLLPRHPNGVSRYHVKEVDMDVATWILVGIVVGALARSFMPGRDRIGSVATIGVSIFGAVFGGWLWVLLFDRYEGFAWVASIVTAVVLLAIYRRLTYGRRGLV